MLRRIPLGETWNLRDLGGYPAAEGRATVWERILRSDNPLGLSEADERWLLERNITTVLDLRSEGEMKRRPSGLRDRPGFTYIPCPVDGGERLPGREADVGRGYFETLDRKESIRKVLQMVADAPGGVLFHCAAGKDRTGLIAALLLLNAGVSRADTVADYQVSGTYLKKFVAYLRTVVSDFDPWAGQSRAEYLELCLDLLEEKYGSVEQYLLAAGLSAGTLEHLRIKLTEG